MYVGPRPGTAPALRAETDGIGGTDSGVITSPCIGVCWTAVDPVVASFFGGMRDGYPASAAAVSIVASV